MYIPESFAETRLEVLRALIRRHPLGTLVVMTAEGLTVNHVPFFVGDGVLRAHVARANPLWRIADRQVQAVAIFQGPDGYVTPSWYPSKAESGGKAVPTWNYVVVHAHGPLRLIEDPAWLRAHLEEMTAAHEAGRAHPWKIGDAPEDYVTGLLGAIVGIELSVSRLEGKWKLSQNRAPADRAAVVEGLRADGDDVLAELVRAAGAADN
jgi:transcriptional regulator